MPIYLLFLGSGQLDLWTPMSLPLVIQSRSNSSAWLAWKILKQIKFLCLYWLKQPFKAEPYAICIPYDFELLWLSHISYVAITLYLTESSCISLSHPVALWVTLYLFGSACISLSHPIALWVTLYIFGSPFNFQKQKCKPKKPPDL